MHSPSYAAVPHLYVHVPFCSGKCTYCALYSVRDDHSRMPRYLDALAREMDAALTEQDLVPDAHCGAASTHFRPETIFLGGGTPSVLPLPLFKQLLGSVHSRLDTGALREWTIEIQPGTLTAEKVQLMRAVGINRASLGVQALNDATLVRVRRRHTVAEVERTIAMLRDGGITNVGIDLIACLPEVSTEEWHATLRHAARLPLQHLSVYALTIEPGTQLAADVKSGAFRPADDDTQVAELDTAETILAEAGYARYEFSNYSRPGRECEHNLGYWRGRDYIGFGPAAASRVGLRRWTNAHDLNAYVSALLEGGAVPRETDAMTAREDMTERLMFGFRLSEGVPLAPFEMDRELATHWSGTLTRLKQHGIVEQLGDRWRLTTEGRLYADSVAEEMILAE